MKIEEANVEVRRFSTTLKDMWEDIEYAARVCYNSHDKTSGSSEKWVRENIIRSGHNRALEFGTVYLTLPWWRVISILRFAINPYSKVHNWRYITTNYRVIHENDWEEYLKYFKYTTKHEERRTLLWTIARGIADEFRTHCTLSTLMQSTRYCKYTSPRHGEQVTFIAPQFYFEGKGANELCKAWQDAEYHYFQLSEMGLKAEQAREVLTLSVKAQCIQCGFMDAWNHFFDMREFPTEHNRPHPDSQYIAHIAHVMLNDAIYGACADGK